MFVTFEGPEGAGKSTVIQALAAKLEGDGIPVVTTREPGSGELGASIRSLILNRESMVQLTELFLFLADRAQHVESLVRPALVAGKIVLCDRFADSTVVYQGHARGLDVERLKELNDFATGGLRPDLTLLLDLPVEVGLSRLKSKDRLDREPVAFHQKVRDGFLVEAGLEPGRWVVVDAARPLGDVLLDADNAVRRLLLSPAD